MRLTAIVHGQVQGVGFRFYAQRAAAGLGLRGYVRNRLDGDVELVAEGQRPALEELLHWLEHGPAGAQVKRVAAEWSTAEGTYSGFQIRV